MDTMTDDQKLALHRGMARVRRLDEFGIDAGRRGKLTLFWHSCRGSESVGVAACSQLRPDDYLYYHYRGHGLPYLVPKGVDPALIFAEHFGKTTGSCHGLSGFHTVAPEVGVYGWGGLLGPQFSIAAGYAMTAKLNGRGQVSTCFFGDGSTNKGQFHESLNVSALWDLPVVWVLENNGIAQFTPLEEHHAGPSGHFVELASAYGIPSELVDGGDMDALHTTMRRAIERARRGEGPSFVECVVQREHGHVMQFPHLRGVEPMSDDEIAAIRALDALDHFEQALLDEGLLTPARLDEIHAEDDAEVAALERFVDESPDPGAIDFHAATFSS